jgi:hypothetical protein
MNVPTRHTPIAVLALVAVSAACGPTVSSTGSHTVHTLNPAQVSGPYAPAGQMVAVHLDQTIDTMVSTRMQQFTARLQTPLLDAQGNVFAPVGSLVHGHVASLGSIEAPRVKLQFDAVDTPFGTLPLSAALLDAQYRQYPGPVVFLPGPDYTGGWGWWGYGGGPWDYGTEAYRPHEVQLPRDAVLHLQLTRPVLAPGTGVIPG